MEISASHDTRGNPPFFALIVAGGSGARFGGAIPKQYQSLNGIPVLRRTINQFLACPGLKGLRVVIHPDHRALYDEVTKGLSLLPPALAGEDRAGSVRSGLAAYEGLGANDVILIHDAARPFITPSHINAVALAAHEKGAATLAARVADTLQREDGAIIDREGIFAVQTPQGFHYALIRDAHASLKDPVTDDGAVAAKAGHPCVIVEGPRTNFKITSPDDWTHAMHLTAAHNETRTGTGYDVHAFDPQNPGPLRLCGIDVAHAHGLAGHSDADVGLHALTDALLGALGDGDIGSHFPPSDPQWKGKDSAHFLKHAVDILAQRGGRIIHLDLTIICEAPKIGPHREKMQARIAEICGITPSRVSVKATTTEQLGFTGRREGIAAQAAATIQLPCED